MAEPLKEYFRRVIASDKFKYGYGVQHDFSAEYWDLACSKSGLWIKPDWIITNPPFREQGEKFVLRALEMATTGVAMFFRSQWLESCGRYERIFEPHPPAVIAQFAERVPLHKGRWKPDGATATGYCWIVWLKNHSGPTEFFWIPPGCRVNLTHVDDIERFAKRPIVRRALERKAA